jgi:hypothetical protein
VKLREDGLHWRRVEDEIIVLDGARYLSINAAGAELWPLLTEGTDRDALVARLVEVFEIDAAQAAADVDGFLADLREQGLLA